MSLFKIINIFLFALVLITPASAAELQPLIIQSDGANHELQVELAITPEQQREGLMHRPSMPANHGMLFVFPRAEMQYFWMKDTLIPLDMIFAAADGQIVHIHPNAQPQDLTMVPSVKPAQYVLELNGGRAAQLGLKIGDKMLIPAAVALPAQRPKPELATEALP